MTGRPYVHVVQERVFDRAGMVASGFFRLDEAVPADHLVRKIGAVLDLSWVYAELAPYYSRVGRPSIDPVLMIRLLITMMRASFSVSALKCLWVQ